MCSIRKYLKLLQTESNLFNHRQYAPVFFAGAFFYFDLQFCHNHHENHNPMLVLTYNFHLPSRYPHPTNIFICNRVITCFRIKKLWVKTRTPHIFNRTTTNSRIPRSRKNKNPAHCQPSYNKLTNSTVTEKIYIQPLQKCGVGIVQNLWLRGILLF